MPKLSRLILPSADSHPWEHPFLCHENLEQFSAYSEAVHVFASEHVRNHGYPRTCAFSVNMAQNMYKWATIAARFGIHPQLIPNPMDSSAINDPLWEDYDGEFADPLDGPRFRETCPVSAPRVETVRVAMDGRELLKFMMGEEHLQARIRNWREWRTVRRGRYRELWSHEATYPYYEWATKLAVNDVSYSASSPIPSYATGKPYLAASVGGDLQIECGRTDDASHLLRQSFAAAEFLLISNPHTLGHSRRLGFLNGVHVPYPMDDARYSPGPGLAREEWTRRSGGEVFVLTTARIDAHVKGIDSNLLDSLAVAARAAPQLRFVFLAWGESVSQFRERMRDTGLENAVLLLPPVGKQRLIDYYRSADIVLDQLVYGYFGASALEAMSIGKPVIMRLRHEQYEPLYRGDVPPIVNVSNTDEIIASLLDLAQSEPRRRQLGRESRKWILRQHGQDVAGLKMANLISVAASRRNLPLHISRTNPLRQPWTAEESAYHARCQQVHPHV